MTQIDIGPEVKLNEPHVPVAVEALHTIVSEWSGHAKEVRTHNRETLAEKRGFGRLVQRAKNIGYSALYTGYFWFDDFPARGLTKLTEGRAADMAIVGAASLAVGGAIAFTRRRHIRNVFEGQGLKTTEAGPSFEQAGHALVLGAPNTVSATAQRGERSTRPLMNNWAIGAAALTYAGLQSVTTVPVIDSIDRILPGSGMSGEVAATTLFVGAAIYTNALVKACYARIKQ